MNNTHSKNLFILSLLSSLAFGFVLAGILFGDERQIGYILLGIGMLLAVIDIFMQRRKATRQKCGTHRGQSVGPAGKWNLTHEDVQP